MMDELDGRIGEGWAGDVPNGSHVNVVLARRGSPTAAAAVGRARAARAPGHAPFLACLGAGARCARPPTIVVNKSTIESERARPRSPGARRSSGIAQGVLDAVADGLIDRPTRPTSCCSSRVWVDPEAHDETAREGREPGGGARRRSPTRVAAAPTAEAARALAAAARGRPRTAFYTGG